MTDWPEGCKSNSEALPHKGNPMKKEKPTYFLTPPRPCTPGGPIRLGAIIPSPTEPDEPLYLPPLPAETNTSQYIEHNWSGSDIKSSSTHFGIWTSFLQVVLGLSADVSIASSKALHRTWAVDRMTTQTFVPSRAFLEQAVQNEDVKAYITDNFLREQIYVITGVMIASSSTISRTRLRERGIYVKTGVDATALGFPVSGGPEVGRTWAASTTESTHRPEDFVFAYRIREIKVRRKDGSVKSHRLYDKGALFDTHVERMEEDMGEVELEGLGDEMDEGEVEGEVRHVRQELDGREEDVVCVLPELID